MAYDEGLAARIREALSEHKDVGDDIVEKRMFGGIAFMVRGNMCCGVLDDKLMVRVGPVAYDKVLKLTHAREMDFTGKKMKGFVIVGQEGIDMDDDLAAWVQLDYASRKYVQEELEWSELLIRANRWATVDVTNKSIEECASEIVALYNRRMGK